ncbi:MAG: glycosyltransferase family 4 protein [Bacteroidota bacterium]
MKKVLVITYYWPPSGGAGVQRWLKFTKYLPEFGWQPIVYTPENPEAPVDDPSLVKDIHPDIEVIRKPIREPYALYKKFVGMNSGQRINAGFLKERAQPRKKEGISVWIRGNLFIPDARKFWIRPSVRFLIRYLKEHPVDAVVSSGPPHSMHLIALGLKRKLGIPWIADFRDPWTEIDFYDQLRLTKRSDRRHKTLERDVVTGADQVVVVGKTMADRFRQVHGVIPFVVPNGYDHTDFDPVAAGKGDPGPGGEFRIVHVGAMNKDRNHESFWKVISELVSEYPEPMAGLKIMLVGKLDVSVRESIAKHGLEGRVEMVDYLPHQKIIPLLCSASALYLPVNNTPNSKSIQTGKLFEYLAAARPIVGIGPVDGDAAHILKTCHSGEMIGFEDQGALKSLLLQWIQWQKEGKLTITPREIDRYTRKHLASTLADQLAKLT